MAGGAAVGFETAFHVQSELIQLGTGVLLAVPRETDCTKPTSAVMRLVLVCG